MDPDEPSPDPQTVLSPESNPDEMSCAMYIRLASWSDQHEVIGGAQTTDAIASAYERTNLDIESHAISVQLPNQALPDINKTIKTRVSNAMSDPNIEFEGVMIDNGAAKSPSGLPAYIRYCVNNTGASSGHPCLPPYGPRYCESTRKSINTNAH